MNGWQPIETAPKDGTWILVCSKDIVGKPLVPVVAAFIDNRGAGKRWRDSANRSDITRYVLDVAPPFGAEWMPLPEKPAPWKPYKCTDTAQKRMKKEGTE